MNWGVGSRGKKSITGFLKFDWELVVILKADLV
jgi:hypothetical protein